MVNIIVGLYLYGTDSRIIHLLSFSLQAGSFAKIAQRDISKRSALLNNKGKGEIGSFPGS